MAKNSKIAIVTGGSRGIGEKTALALAEKGIDIIITYNSQKEKADLVVNAIKNKGCNAVALQLNVGNVSSFDLFKDQLIAVLRDNWNRKSFDFLINNAGFANLAPFASITEEQFDNMMNVHFKGVFFLTQKLVSIMANNGGIINLSSGLARFTKEGFSAYASMKGAIEVLTRYMAKELASRGIRANVVAPGVVDTEFHDGSLDSKPGAKEFFASETAFGRVGQPEEIGSVIATLCTSDMAWVTAQRIEASGGMLL